MRNKILLYVVLLLSTSLGCIRSFQKETSFFINEPNIINVEQPNNQLLIAVKDTKTDVITNLNLEEYLIGVVAGEMPASFNDEALKAQAVAARTYAYYKMANSNMDYDVTNDSSTQVHLTDLQMHDKWQDGYDLYYNKVRQAVIDTSGEVITYNNEIIPAFYFAMSNGYTENSELVFSEAKDYLVSVESPESKEKYEYHIDIDKATFCSSLDIDCQNIDINDIQRSSTGRVLELRINGQEYTGKQVKYLLNLRSTDFDIIVNNSELEIITRGFGHGVGMSQYGANNLANEGLSYKQILAHYYTNTKIVNLASII